MHRCVGGVETRSVQINIVRQSTHCECVVFKPMEYLWPDYHFIWLLFVLSPLLKCASVVGTSCFCFRKAPRYILDITTTNSYLSHCWLVNGMLLCLRLAENHLFHPLWDIGSSNTFKVAFINNCNSKSYFLEHTPEKPPTSFCGKLLKDRKRGIKSRAHHSG